MKILVACEESQVVTKTFRDAGLEAYSCDIFDCSGGHPEWHIKGDAIVEAYLGRYDMMIAHPPCTYLTVSGNKWMKPEFKERFPNRQQQREYAIIFFTTIYNAPIEHIAVENPVGIMSTRFRKPDQYIHPFQFGHSVSKKTGLWLKNLPPLKPTFIVEPEYVTCASKTYSKFHYDTGHLSTEQRSKARSTTFQGIANAMVQQWGALL